MSISSGGTHWKGPLLGSQGLFEDLSADVLSKAQSRYNVWFEDFDFAPIVAGEATAAGLALSNVNTATSPTQTVDPADGFMLLNPGTKADSGTQFQWNGVITGGATTPVYRTPGSIVSTATLMDDRELIWAARVGIQSDATLFTGKILFGWFTIDTSLQSATTGLPTVAAGGGAGFHLFEDGTFSVVSTNLAITAVGTALAFPDYSTAGSLTASTMDWHEYGIRMRWGDAGTGVGRSEFYVDGVLRQTIENTMPMDSTESYATSFSVINGPTGTGEIIDVGIDWMLVAMTRPGLTNLTAG